MKKLHKITSVKNFETIQTKKPHLKDVPLNIIKKFLRCQKYAIIEEIEDPFTLLTSLRILPCKKAKNILYKIEIIKENLNKYAKEGIDNPDNCEIENLRKEIIDVKKEFGEKIREDYVYHADKYKDIRTFVRDLVFIGKPLDMPEKVGHQIVGLMADVIIKNQLYLNENFSNKLIKILIQEEALGKNIEKFLSDFISFAGNKYKKIIIDFSILSRKCKFNVIDIQQEGNYEFSKLNCTVLTVKKGTIDLSNSAIDKLGLQSKELKYIKITNVLTEIKPKFAAKKVTIKNLKTYMEVQKKRVKMVRDSLKRLPPIIFSSSIQLDSSIWNSIQPFKKKEKSS